MAAGGAFEARLHRVRQDFEKLHHGMHSLARHLKVMRRSSGSWSQAVDQLQSLLNTSLQHATLLRKETLRVTGEAEALIRQAPRPERSLHVGQKPSPPVRAELRGKVQRLERDASLLDRELRGYHRTVQRMANDPMRHSAGADPIEAIKPLADLIGQIGDIVDILRGFSRKSR